MEFTIDEREFSQAVEEVVERVLPDQVEQVFKDNVHEVAEQVGEHLGDPAEAIDWQDVIREQDLVTSDDVPTDFVTTDSFDEHAVRFTIESLNQFSPDRDSMCEMGRGLHDAITGTVKPMVDTLVADAVHAHLAAVNFKAIVRDAMIEAFADQPVPMPDPPAQTTTWAYVHVPSSAFPHQAVRYQNGVEVGRRRWVNRDAADRFIDS